MELNGIAAVVTGGASGLGGATAQMLAGAGAKVAIFDVNEEVGQTHAAAIGGVFFKTDVTDPEAVSQALLAAEERHGVARVLVNCAGIAPAMKTVTRDGQPHAFDVFRRAVEINLLGSFNVLSNFAARLMQADPLGEERGVIVNTASIAAYEGQIGQAAYAASKGGVVSMTLPVARDLADQLIRVCTIAPGIFLTPMLKSLPEPAQAALGKMTPHPARLGKPEEYARLVRVIVENPMLNGETIRLDGAIRMSPK